jgi:hypothetical protein
LRVGFGAVDVGPGGGVKDEIGGLQPGGWRDAYVPVGVSQSYELVTFEDLGERPPELTARAGN